MKIHAITFLAGALLALSACGPQELILDGERLDYRDPFGTGETAGEVEAPGSAPFAAPGQVANAEWPPAPGRTINATLDTPLAPVWSLPIGRGEDRKHRISAMPVVADGRVYTMDSRARVAATSTGGAALWSTDLTPATDNPDDATGGGIAVSGGRVFATTGFAEVSALDAATGSRIWTHKLTSAPNGAPGVSEGRVYVAALDGTGVALDAATGRVLWTVTASSSPTGVIADGSPVATGNVVVFPFASNELVALEPSTGTQIWTAYILGERLGRVYARVSDVTGGPVLAGDTVYAGTHSGQTVAIDAGTGRERWRADDGALSPPLVAGGSVFVISDQSELIRLDAATGDAIWRVPLPYFTRERVRRQAEIFAHYGPVLAGGEVVVVSNDGLVRTFSPTDGALLSSGPLPSGAAAEPAVAGGTLFVVGENGTLTAFR